jgi:hypothetical protein
MDNKKLVAVSVLAVLALAFAGYGYADYTATTYNSGNELAAQYITVTPGSWNALSAGANDLEIDTYTYTEDNQTTKYLYKVNDDGLTVSAIDADSPVAAYVQNDEFNYYVALGNSLTLTIRDGTVTDWETFDITVKTVGTISGNDYYKVVMAIAGDDAEPEFIDDFSADASITDFTPADGGVVTVSLFLLVNYDVEVDDDFVPGEEATVGSSEAPASAQIIGEIDDSGNKPVVVPVSFVFKVVGNTEAA